MNMSRAPGLMDYFPEEKAPRMTRESKVSAIPDYLEEVVPGNPKMGYLFKPEGATDSDITDSINRSLNAGLITEPVAQLLLDNLLASQGDINQELNNYAQGVDDQGNMLATDSVMEQNFPRGMPKTDAGIQKGMVSGTRKRLKEMHPKAKPHSMEWYLRKY